MKTLFTLTCSVIVAAFNATAALSPNHNATAALSPNHNATAALSPNHNATAFNHLVEVNKQWSKHKSDATVTTKSFATDVDRIQYHLLNVEQYLRNHTPSGLSAEALQNRPRLLDLLNAYANNKTFPTNTRHAQRTPYFIDDYNVYCAVGYLISASGHDALARRINNEHRYDYIHDITTNGLVDWANKFGFTVDELAWIQPAYAPTTQFAPLQAGTDGPVNLMFSDSYYGGVVFAGQFFNVNNMPCSSIGRYKDNQLECFGNGLAGVVNDVITTGEGVLAAGDIGSTAMNAPLAIFNFSTSMWEQVQIPQVPGAIGHKVYYGGMNHSKLLVISEASTPGQRQIWFQLNDGTWEKQATVYGSINDIEFGNTGLVYVGMFEMITAHKPTGDVDVMAHNVVIHDNSTDEWHGIGADVSDEVLVVKNIGGALYLAGKCGGGSLNEICLTRYLNGVLQPLLLSTAFSDTDVVSLNAMQLFNNDELIVGGDFEMNQMIVSGQNLGSFSLVNNYIVPLGVLNDAVTGVGEYNGEIYLGGHFTINMIGGEALPYLAKIEDPNTVTDPTNKINLQLYPNPATNSLTVSTTQNVGLTSLEVVDLLGRSLMQVEIKETALPHTIDIADLSSGMYTVVLNSNSSRYVEKFQVVK